MSIKNKLKGYALSILYIFSKKNRKAAVFSDVTVNAPTQTLAEVKPSSMPAHGHLRDITMALDAEVSEEWGRSPFIK